MIRLNNKGFTLVELLTVIVILITILLIAIPSITASLSRSENKQLDAQKKSIIASVYIKIKKSDFNDYNSFKNKTCSLSVDELYNLGYISQTLAQDKNKEYIEGCVIYSNSTDENLEFIDDGCPSECEMVR